MSIAVKPPGSGLEANGYAPHSSDLLKDVIFSVLLPELSAHLLHRSAGNAVVLIGQPAGHTKRILYQDRILRLLRLYN